MGNIINNVKEKLLPYKSKIDNLKNKKNFGVRIDVLIYILLAIIVVVLLFMKRKSLKDKRRKKRYVDNVIVKKQNVVVGLI